MKCFNNHNKNKSSCERKKCRYWIESANNNNCTLNIVKKEKSLTLEEIGNLFSVTRMRICQIEKYAIKKIREQVSDLKNKTMN